MLTYKTQGDFIRQDRRIIRHGVQYFVVITAARPTAPTAALSRRLFQFLPHFIAFLSVRKQLTFASESFQDHSTVYYYDRYSA